MLTPTPHAVVVWIALAFTIVSFIPKLQISWRVPVLCLAIAALLP
jgi:hypothetical protein